MIPARENPFRVDRVLAIRFDPSVLGETWDDLFKRLASLHYRAAVIGPEGTGKTTFLEDVAPLLQAHGFRPRPLWMNRDEVTAQEVLGQADGAGPADFFLFDGAEQLSWWQWRCFLRRTRRAGGILISGHRAGRLPTLLQCRTTPALLRSILGTLIPTDPLPTLAVCEELLDEHDGNVRETLRFLYDQWGRHGCIPLPTVPTETLNSRCKLSYVG